MAVAPAAAARGVSVISFSNDATVARPGLYVLGFRPEEQIERIVRYAGAQGRARIARRWRRTTPTANGRSRLAARRSPTMPGATAVITQTYPAQSDSPRDAVEYVAAFGRPDGLPAPVTNPDGSVSPPPGLPPPGFDALLIADGGPRVLSIAALLAYYDVRPAPRRCWARCAGRTTPRCWPIASLRVHGSRPGRPTRSGGLHAPLRRRLWPRCRHRWRCWPTTPPPWPCCCRTAQPRFTAAQLTAPQGFAGGAGIFRLRPDGLAEHGLAVIQVDAGSSRVIDPAPASFNDGLAQR